jgi:hypothetical protein
MDDEPNEQLIALMRLPTEIHLMRAAPKLLAALKLLMHEVDASGNGTAPDYGWPAAVSASREAIAEAEGGCS